MSSLGTPHHSDLLICVCEADFFLVSMVLPIALKNLTKSLANSHLD